MFPHIAPHFEKSYAGDAHPDLVLMWRAIAQGWTPPEHVSEEEYQALRHAAPSALRGFVGFGCSFGAKWFGGYARGVSARGRVRSFAQEAARSVEKARAALQKATTIANVSFMQWPVVPGVVLYCDPPYANTTGYTTGAFDPSAFWARLREWHDAGSYVFVSEFHAPGDWEIAWETQRKRQMELSTGGPKAVLVERLFTRRMVWQVAA